jgi:hypothetical protein
LENETAVTDNKRWCACGSVDLIGETRMVATIAPARRTTDNENTDGYDCHDGQRWETLLCCQPDQSRPVPSPCMSLNARRLRHGHTNPTDTKPGRKRARINTDVRTYGQLRIGLPNPTVLSWRRDRCDTKLPILQALLRVCMMWWCPSCISCLGGGLLVQPPIELSVACMARISPPQRSAVVQHTEV